MSWFKYDSVYSMQYAFKTFYLVPLIVAIVAILLFFPPLHALVGVKDQPAWFWTRIFILAAITYMALVLMN